MFNANISDLKNQTSGQWLSILHALAPQLNQACERPGRHVACPIHGGKDGFRLFNDAYQKGGGCCNTCGVFSNGFAILMWINNWTFREALNAVRDYLGCGGYISPPRTAFKPAPETNWESKRKWIQMLWDEAVPGHPRLNQYFECRNLCIDPPPSLRLHGGLKYLKNQKRNLGEFPCMVAQITRGREVVGLHVTFLDPKGPGKADVPASKKVWKCADSISGGSIHLFEPDPNQPLALTEGIESALAVREMMGLPVWACVSAGMLERVEIPESVSEVIIAGDLDRSGRGQQATEQLAERLHREGRKVKIAVPPGPIPGGEKSIDWLDVLAGSREVVNV